jgi:peptidoglycan hydrolase-like protein with peptidoglycan-binding domain
MPLILQKGVTGDEVKLLQYWLNTHGYECGSEDGEYGEKTRDAVIQFQAAKSIVADGIVGPQTRQTMDKISKAE